jgi:hypothetical protein
MAEVDTSSYRDNTLQSPLAISNQLLENQQKQQAVQENNIKLATDRFGMINNAASGLLQDPELGKSDVTSKLWDTLGRLTKGDAMSAQHAVQFMQQFPQDPRQQRQAIQAVHAQTLDAWQKGQAYLGQTVAQDSGGGTNYLLQKAFGQPPQDTGKYLPKTNAPGTSSVVTDQNSPDYGRTNALGGQGVPRLQDSMPATPVAPSRGAVPSSPSVVGDNEAVARGLYPAQPGIKPVTTSLAPDEGAAMKGSSDAYDAAMQAAGKYAQRVNPLRQAIPLLEKMKDTEIGPTSERWNDIKSTAQTLGAGTLAGIDPEKIKNYNELKKYFNQYTSQAAATLGPKTNEGLATAVTSNPNVHMDKLSATDLSKMALGVERMQQAAALAFNDQIQSGKAKPGSFNRFMLKFGTDYDPRSFVYDIMDKKGQDKIDNLKGAELKKFIAGINLAKKYKLIGDVHSE